MKMLVVMFILWHCLTGCATIQPDRISQGWKHDSFPADGWPRKAAETEDTLDVADLQATWKRGHWQLDASLGYVMRDGGVYHDGPPVIFNMRVSRDIWAR